MITIIDPYLLLAISRVGAIVSCPTSAAFLSSTRRLHLHAPWTARVIPHYVYGCIIPLSANPNQDETTMEPHLRQDMAGSQASPTSHTRSFSHIMYSFFRDPHHVFYYYNYK
jgi:hypothetical protein